MNMLALILIGPALERLLGTWRFAAVYLLAALGSSVTGYAFDSRYVAVAGASGAIYGLFAAGLLLVRGLQVPPPGPIGPSRPDLAVTLHVAGGCELRRL